MSTRVHFSDLDGVRLILGSGYSDERGRSVSSSLPFVPVVDFISWSNTHVLRGLHFQPGMTKLVRCIVGVSMEVLVDLRPKSVTFGKHARGTIRSGEAVLIPDGVAHGFVAIRGDIVLHYLLSAAYDKSTDGRIRWNDPDLAINWKTQEPLVSQKDREAMLFSEYKETIP